MAAHGAFIRSLTTHTDAGITPVKGRPLVDSAAHEPPLNYPNIFFPAGLVTVNRDVAFGVERVTAVVSMGRFRPDDTGNAGIEQSVDSIGLDIGYSNSTDIFAPQIKQTGAVQTGAMTFTAFVRVSEDSGALHRVAVLYNTGDPTWQVKELSNVGGDLWTGTITTTSPGQIVLDAEAQDNPGNVGFSFNKAVNFQSVPDTSAPSIIIEAPLPNRLVTLNQPVQANFSCSDPGGVASCLGSSDGGPSIQSGGLLASGILGGHDFTVTSTDLAGHTTSRTVQYFVLGLFGFRPPVDNPPILNVVKPGSTAPIKWYLKDANGNYYRSLSSVTSVSSRPIDCGTATLDPLGVAVPSGLGGLKYDLSGEQFVYNWQTQKTWAGTCRRLFVGLVGNGVLPYADFEFK
jgi:hypothetical protein